MNKLKHFRIYCDIAISPAVISRAVKIALFVGSALNLINQGSVILTFTFENLSIVKLLFTYLVPYSVTTYTATAMKIEFQIGTLSPITTDLQCKGCGEQIHIEKNELIPECPVCGIKTKWRLK